jgi:hypothetical protein
MAGTRSHPRRPANGLSAIIPIINFNPRHYQKIAYDVPGEPEVSQSERN